MVVLVYGKSLPGFPHYKPRQHIFFPLGKILHISHIVFIVTLLYQAAAETELHFFRSPKGGEDTYLAGNSDKPGPTGGQDSLVIINKQLYPERRCGIPGVTPVMPDSGWQGRLSHKVRDLSLPVSEAINLPALCVCCLPTKKQRPSRVLGLRKSKRSELLSEEALTHMRNLQNHWSSFSAGSQL